MNIRKKFVDKLLCERHGVLHYLITDKKNGLGIVSTLKNFTKQLEQIFYTISYLEKLDLISIQKNGDNFFIDYENFFEGYKEKGKKGEVNTIMYLTNEVKEKCFWYIEIKPTLFHYKENGYMTDEEKRERKKFLLTIGSVILAAIVAVLSIFQIMLN